MCQFGQGIGFHAGEHRRHETTNRFGIDDGVADLPRLHGHQPAPDRIALGPKVFAFVVKAFRLPVHHHAQRHTVDAGADAPVVQRSAGINGHHVRLGWVTNRVRTLVHHVFDECALVVARTSNQEVVRRPFAQSVLSPGLAQPLDVRLKTTRGQHAGFGGDAFAAHRAPGFIGAFVHDVGGDKMAVGNVECFDLGVVLNLNPQVLSAAVVRIDQCFAAAHEECIGPCGMQSARQRGLKAHPMLEHPGPACGRTANGQAGHVFIGDAARDFEQVLPEFFFRVGLHQHILRGIVHAAQVAGVHRVAAAPIARG